MKCRDYEAQVQPFLAGELPDVETEKLIRHVLKCERCYDELEIYFSVFRGLGYSDEKKLIEDDGFEFDGTKEDLNQMLNQILQEIEKRKATRELKLVFAFLGIVIGGICLLILGGHILFS